MINVVARFIVKDGFAEEFEAAVASARPAYLSDEGCLRFDLQRQLKSTEIYILLESYADKDALRRHSEMKEFAEFRAATAELIEGPAEVTLLSPVGEQIALAG
ncbi:putative quinol monooxygenase [Kribbia dieselivorans]|uniref:putative quinol monooxygenase n=1 Tax=Kribbia dieselivorans TaxID=331526 RepID=UPI0008387AE4|nr:putative quinol monooxygenase [Kribbia dieselivorans]